METLVAGPPTAEDIYERTVKPMAASERLKLATRILNDISPASLIDFSDEWTDHDLRRLSDDSVRRFYDENPAEDGLV